MAFIRLKNENGIPAVDVESRGYFVIALADGGPACPKCEHKYMDSVTEYNDSEHGPTHFSCINCGHRTYQAIVIDGVTYMPKTP